MIGILGSLGLESCFFCVVCLIGVCLFVFDKMKHFNGPSQPVPIFLKSAFYKSNLPDLQNQRLSKGVTKAITCSSFHRAKGYLAVNVFLRI